MWETGTLELEKARVRGRDGGINGTERKEMIILKSMEYSAEDCAHPHV